MRRVFDAVGADQAWHGSRSLFGRIPPRRPGMNRISNILQFDSPYWSRDAAAVSAALGSGPGGLSAQRAAAQLCLVGPNSVEDASHLGALRLFLPSPTRSNTSR